MRERGLRLQSPKKKQKKKHHQHREELCPPVLSPPEETLVLSHLTARFIGSSVRGCMIPSHLSPDSGVIDSDLCERRQECHRENMFVSSHQFCSAPMEPDHIWNSKKSQTVMLQCDTSKTCWATTNTYFKGYAGPWQRKNPVCYELYIKKYIFFQLKWQLSLSVSWLIKLTLDPSLGWKLRLQLTFQYFQLTLQKES